MHANIYFDLCNVFQGAKRKVTCFYSSSSKSSSEFIFVKIIFFSVYSTTLHQLRGYLASVEYRDESEKSSWALLTFTP